jgi:transposase InsO family protein
MGADARTSNRDPFITTEIAPSDRFDRRRLAAHGRQAVVAFPRPRPPCHRLQDREGAQPRRRLRLLHCVVDDHTRLAYVELHPREDAETNARTLERALAFFAELGLRPEALMTDNAFVYTRSRRFKTLLAERRLRHIVTPKYTPRWNGKVERFIRTLQDEWAYVHRWPSSSERARTLSSFIRYYNRQRPHSSLGDRPPISRVHNLRGQDS